MNKCEVQYIKAEILKIGFENSKYSYNDVDMETERLLNLLDCKWKCNDYINYFHLMFALTKHWKNEDYKLHYLLQTLQKNSPFDLKFALINSFVSHVNYFDDNDVKDMLQVGCFVLVKENSGLTIVGKIKQKYKHIFVMDVCGLETINDPNIKYLRIVDNQSPQTRKFRYGDVCSIFEKPMMSFSTYGSC